MSDKVELTGMVLSAVPMGEYDKRIVLLTKERGKISGFAKGARRQNSPLLAAAKPFSFGTFECFEGRSSYNIYQASISNYFEVLSTDFESAYYGMYFLEIADYYTRENSDEREMLKLLYVSLRALEKKRPDRKLVRLIFELKAMTIAGEYPQCFCCTGCGSTGELTGFSFEKNGMLCRQCIYEFHGEKLLESTIYAMQYIISSPVEKLYTFTVSEEVLLELQRIMARLCRTFIDKKLKTLEIIETLQI